MTLLMLLPAITLLAETLNVAGLLDTDSLFSYANILLTALIPIVLISIGFTLAKYVISFVQRIFNSL